METSTKGRRVPLWLTIGAAVVALVLGGWVGFVLGRLSPGWRPAAKDVAISGLPGLDWKKVAADAGVAEWTVLVDQPSAERMEERRLFLVNYQPRGQHQNPLSPITRFVMAQAVVPKDSQRKFAQSFQDGFRECLRLQGFNPSNTVGGGSTMRRKWKEPMVDTKFEGIRYSRWSEESSPAAMVGEAWIAVSFDDEVATLIVFLAEVVYLP